MKPTLLMLIAMIALMLLAAPAGATMQYFTNQSEWIAATSGVFTIDFDDVSVTGQYGYDDYSVTGLQIHGVDFSATPNSEGGLVLYSQSSAYPYRSSFSGNFLVGNTYGTKTFTANLPANVTALALLVLTENPGGTVAFNFTPTDSYTMVTTSDTTPDFIGFIFDQPVQSVTLDSGNRNFVGLDNFAYAIGDAATPEANSIWLGGAGILALWAARRMRRLRLQPPRRG
ncbi:MAG: hypothetical protein ACE141_03945 [Bryobacteraceae bacterium]